jgi:hydrogenase maturation protease
MKTVDEPVLVLCLGNDLRQDDGVGWAIADALEADPPPGADVRRSALSGFYLLDELVDRRHAIVVDAIQTGRRPPGTVLEFTMEALATPSGPSPHAVGLPTVLDLGRRSGLALPDRVDVVAVEVENMAHVAEGIGETARRAIPEAVVAVRRRLQAIRTMEGASAGEAV